MKEAAAKSESKPAETLADLRVDIDRIDGDIHRLLIERGDTIDRLIAIKARQGGGSAFRPEREASMIRAIVRRHRGALPLDTVEGIWRVIISTFTYVQSPYSVHADFSGGDAAMRDCARFHFGFTTPCVVHLGPAGVIDAVARAAGDLGLCRVDSGPVAGAWWRGLGAPDAPKIIARLPFVERPDHPAALPTFVIAKPLAEAAARETDVFAISTERWRDGFPAALAALGAEISGHAGDSYGLSLMVSAPGGIGAQAIVAALEGAGAGGARASWIGSHAARYSHAP